MTLMHINQRGMCSSAVQENCDDAVGQCHINTLQSSRKDKNTDSLAQGLGATLT